MQYSRTQENVFHTKQTNVNNNIRLFLFIYV